MRTNNSEKIEQWFFLTPLLCGGIAAALLFGLASSVVGSFTGGLLVMLLSLATGWFLLRKHQAGIEQVSMQMKDMNEGQKIMAARVFPIWAHQLEIARDSGNQAVTSLAGHFGGLVTRIEKSLAATQHVAVNCLNGGGMSGTETAPAATLEHYKAFEETVNEMEREYEQVRDGISSVLVDLQFQDRISQLLTLVIDEMNELRDCAAAGDAQAIDTDSWSRVVQNHLRLAEQHRSSLLGTDDPAIAHKETTLF